MCKSITATTTVNVAYRIDVNSQLKLMAFIRVVDHIVCNVWPVVGGLSKIWLVVFCSMRLQFGWISLTNLRASVTEWRKRVRER